MSKQTNVPPEHTVAATPVTNIEKEKLADTSGGGDRIVPQSEEPIEPMKLSSEDENDANTIAGQANRKSDPPVASEGSTIAGADLANPKKDDADLDWKMRDDVDLPSEKIPPFLDNVFSDAERYLLPGESDEELLNLFFELEAHFKTKNLIEYWLVFECTMLLWEIIRYRRMKIAVMCNHQRAAVESLFRRTHDGRVPQDAVRKYFSDPVFRSETCKAFEAAGFTSDAVEVEAFQRSLLPIAEIERLIASAQKRVAAFTKDLEKRYADRAVRLSIAALKAAMEDT